MGKKLLSLLFASTLLLSACGDTGEPETTEEPETEKTSQDVEVEEADGEEEEGAEEEAEEVVEESAGNEVVLGEPMELGEYTLTIQKYSLGVDYEGNNALII